jgi:hypothetical protein
MHAVIDVARDVSAFATRLAAAGVRTVIRYYNHRNSAALPSKCLTNAELDTLHDAGLAVAVIFQQRGGADGHIEDLDAANGDKDASRALELAAAMQQPAGSAIYFAVDWDYAGETELARLVRYFERAKAALGGRYRVGVFGSGMVGRHLKARGLVDLVWLASDLRWSGTRAALDEGDWSLFQSYPHEVSPIGGFGYDGNIVNPAVTDYGQFTAWVR